MRKSVWMVVGMLLMAAAFIAMPARAGFNTNFTDPAGDTVDFNAPPQALQNNADVTAGASSATVTNITLTLTLVGNIGYPGASLSYTLGAHGADAYVIISIDGTTLDASGFYGYDYTPGGGGSGFGIIGTAVTGNTVSVSLPREWGGVEATYLLTFSTMAIEGSAFATDEGGQINQSPSITNGPGATVNRDVLTLFTYDFEATDPEGDALTWSVLADPAASWLTIDPGTGVLSGTPPVAGSWDITVDVTDPFSNTDFYYFTLNAATCAANVAPTITNDVSGSQTIGLTGTYTHDYAATDPEAGTLTWSVSDSIYAVIDADTGVLAFIALGVPGTYTLTVTVTDPCAATDTSTLTIVVSSGGGTDTDGDGTPDATDTDDDNDGVADLRDPQPLNPLVPAAGDYDGDGTPDATDPDDDGDGVPDTSDQDPRNPSVGILAAAPLFGNLLLWLLIIVIIIFVVIAVVIGLIRRGKGPSQTAPPQTPQQPPPPPPPP